MSVVLDNVTMSFSSTPLFEEVTVAFNPGHRYALTGPNGAGKSTFVKIITGEIIPTSGTVSRPGRLGVLRQNIEAFRDYSVIDTVIMGNGRLWGAFQERDCLYEGEMTDAVGMRLGELEEIIADEDGYMAEAAAEALLVGMGIETLLHQEKMGAIPTDLQFRALLAQAVFGSPEALLLDEPTNHLDLHSITWLEKFLHSYSGTMIVISHDRHFLNAVATDIADIDYQTVILYPGNYDEMVITKTAVRERSEAEAKSKEKKIAQLKEFVAKFGAGTRASQVQSRIKEIDKLQPQELKKSNIQRPYIRFSVPEKKPGKIVCKINALTKRYDSLSVIDNFSLEIHRGDKIGVIGNNGRGKTTLLKTIAGKLIPDGGTIENGHQVIKSYFPQDHSDLLDKVGDESVFEWLRERKSGIYDQDIRGVLGKMLFGGDDAFKKVATLSGGETARLILGGMMLEEHNFVILDEPNNHLDLEAVSALAWGLQDYKGTVVVVSHDRDLINHVATKIVAFEEDGIKVFDGSLEEYLQIHQTST
ncbi:MAG: ATP-binding cassette domain-containing protein [Chlamydiia bacterium]|nr:ATP-binding cassette domain-containing protein [Chlamydiia bacterium]